MTLKLRFEDLHVGDRFSFTRTLGEGDAALFIAASGDFNPHHIDDGFARRHRFGRRIVPGLLTVSLFTHIGGDLGFLATKVTLEYVAPVLIGDTITATVTITDIDAKRKYVRLTGVATNQAGSVVVRGETEGFPSLEEAPGRSGDSGNPDMSGHDEVSL